MNMVHEVFHKRNKIASNLNREDISFIDARKLSIEQLYQAINGDWCYEYDEILRGPRDVPEELLYDENTYRRILELITDSGILVDINHDSKECSRLGRRLQRDLNKICKNENFEQTCTPQGPEGGSVWPETFPTFDLLTPKT